MAKSSEIESDDVRVVEVVEDAPPGRYLTGARAISAGVGLGLSVFLPALEVSVISTSLITISADLNGFEQSSWVITAYLVTYTGFLMLWSKLSDLVGLKSALITSMVLFMAFSAGCGASNSITELIIFRALQGVGGAGLYAVSTIGFIQMVPPSQYKQITSIASSIMSLGMILGPLVGGGINNSGAWRWVFYLNLPAGALALVVVILMIPNRFPNHCDPRPEGRKKLWSIESGFFQKADVLGAFFLLGASILLVAGLQEGNVRFPWGSATIVSLFVVSGILWVAFLLWERFASRESSKLEPMFPWRFFSNRVWMGVLFGCFLSGGPLTIAVIELPQRYQVVNNATPLGAGVRLLAYAVSSPIGIVMATIIIGKGRVPFLYVLLAGIALQTTGFVLLSTVPNTLRVWPGQYGYSVIAGLGTGGSIGSLYMMAPIVVDKRDQALAIGSTLQFRMLGGALGVAIANTVLNSYVRSHLKPVLSGSELDEILVSVRGIARLPPITQERVRMIYGDAYNRQMLVTVGIAAAHVLAVAIMWKRKPLRLSKTGEPE